MYTVSVPISMETVTPESLPQFGKLLKELDARRVFLCCVGELYRKDGMLFAQADTIRQAIGYFQGLGLEVGLWVNTFGHGELLAHQTQKDVGDYTPIQDVHGGSAPVAFCPLDPRFRQDLKTGIAQAASLGPDLIMLDDDLRFAFRKQYYTIGCFCPAHKKRYEALLGEKLQWSTLEEQIFAGKPNRYRAAYLQMMGSTLLELAEELRREVDGVDPTIRLGASVSAAMWDSSGTDTLALAKAFAGNTRPFARIAGAPYHDPNIIGILERSRQQCAWGKDSGVELFCEGDTYPRPRYNVPSRPLELFDLAMACDGTSDGMLQYVFDYTHSLSYEQGYARRLIRNRPLREKAAALFAGKQAVGVRVFDVMHKLQTWQLPETLAPGTVRWITATPSKGVAAEVLGRNAIPTTYAEGDAPLLLLGESARHIPLELLNQGAVLDVPAAQILQSRGVDTGLLTAEQTPVEWEYFPKEGQTVRGIGKSGKLAITCKGQVESFWLPGNTPASYRYENEARQRFFVLAMDLYAPGVTPTANALRSWCRRRQLVEALTWVGRKPLPLVLEDAPDTWVLAARDENTMAVAIANLSLDAILEPVLQLDRPYSRVRGLNCQATLTGDRLQLDTVPPYGFVVLELS